MWCKWKSATAGWLGSANHGMWYVRRGAHYFDVPQPFPPGSLIHKSAPYPPQHGPPLHSRRSCALPVDNNAHTQPTQPSGNTHSFHPPSLLSPSTPRSLTPSLRFSTPAAGDCNGTSSSSATCSWRVVRVQKTVNATCVTDHVHAVVQVHGASCFSTCPLLPGSGVPDPESDCYIECFYQTILVRAAIS